MVLVFGFRFPFRRVPVLYPYLIGSEFLVNRKDEYQFVGKQFYSLLILLAIILCERLEMVLMFVLDWIHGLDANGNIFYLLY